jgi:hypothetical protein
MLSMPPASMHFNGKNPRAHLCLTAHRTRESSRDISVTARCHGSSLASHQSITRTTFTSIRCRRDAGTPDGCDAVCGRCSAAPPRMAAFELSAHRTRACVGSDADKTFTLDAGRDAGAPGGCDAPGVRRRVQALFRSAAILAASELSAHRTRACFACGPISHCIRDLDDRTVTSIVKILGQLQVLAILPLENEASG